MTRVDKSIYAAGIRFECQGCGRCCATRGEYSHVYVSLPERRRLARHLGVSTRDFTMRYCQKTHGFHHLRDPHEGCLFLRGGICQVYDARPDQCRTWPFWLENMNRGVWHGEVMRDCPGVGRGRLFSADEIEERLREERRRQDKD